MRDYHFHDALFEILKQHGHEDEEGKRDDHAVRDLPPVVALWDQLATVKDFDGHSGRANL